MKRRIIKQGHNTFTVSLPRKWCTSHGLKEGEEIDVTEKGNALLLSKEAYRAVKEVKIDVTGLDRSTIILLIQSLYTYGYDNITVTTKDSKAKYHWKGEDVGIPSIINYAVSRLIGAEIISSSNNIYKIQVITAESKERFNLLLRRTFRLLIELFDTYVERYRKKDVGMIENIEFIYLNLRKFMNYSLRLLNKFGHEEADKTTFYYGIIMCMSRISETLKNLSGPRQRPLNISAKCCDIIEEINKSFKNCC